MGPGHYSGTPLPGEAGNSAIAGHRTTYLRPFYSLNALRPGDRIIVTTVQGTFTYRMTSSLIVSPNDVSVVAPTPFPELTLTTCNPRWSATQRLVVHARLTASVLAPGTAGRNSGTETLGPKARRLDAAALSGHGGRWPLALAWGAGVLVLAVALDEARRRLPGSRRAAALAGGVAIWLVVLFFFFGAVGPLLPASF
jgi:LPXTG-site transpeptidase (sortase) family protein